MLVLLAAPGCLEAGDSPDAFRSDNGQAPAVSAQADDVDVDACAPGTEPVEPGCGPAPSGLVIPEAGCYTPCGPAGADCSAGEACVEIYGNPCICDPGDACCRACGADGMFYCMPLLDSCPPGEVYAEPGCDAPFPGTQPLPEAGCYEECKAAGAPCGDGRQCAAVHVNPCVCPAGEACCQACGGTTLLCMDAPA